MDGDARRRLSPPHENPPPLRARLPCARLQRLSRRNRGRSIAVPEVRPHDDRRLLLPGGLAGEPVAARHREHEEAAPGVRPHGRIRLGLHGARGGEIRLRMAGPRRPALRGPGPEGRPLHAEPHAPGLARGGPPRDPHGGRAGPEHAARGARAGDVELRNLPALRRPHRGRARQAVRQQPQRLGMAARQRAEPLRQRDRLQRRLPGEVPGVAEEVRHGGRAELRLGKLLLVADVPEFRPDPPSQHEGARGRPEPRGRA